MSLRLRILEVALLPLLLAVGLFAFYFAHRVVSEAEDSLMRSGRDATSHLSGALAYELFAGNMSAIHQIMTYESAAYRAQAIGLMDGQNWLVVTGDARIFSGQRLQKPEPFWRQGETLYFSQALQQQASGAETDPYLAQGRDIQRTYVVVALSREGLSKARDQVILAAAGMGLVVFLVALVLAWRIATKVSQPVIDLTHGVSRLADGKLSERVRADASGEVGELQRGINRMAETLEAHQNELHLRIAEATTELVDQKQAAEAAVLAKSRFLAAASHDIRQPLHAMSLLVEALKDRVGEGEARRLAENIEASASAMQTLLNTLLDLSKLDAGVIEAHPECMPVMRVLEPVAQQFAPVAREKGLSLRIHPSQLWIYHDPALLGRIVSNLVSNAIRYTDQGGVLVGFRRVQQDWVRLEVWDTGRGIPAQFHDRIFEEYFQLENPERHRDKGLGLGLAIVSRLARLLGGQVMVHSQPNRGSCFQLGIPRCPAPLNREVESTSSSAVSLPMQDALVAFIDDDLTILEAMVEMFDHWGVPLAVGEDADQVRRELEELGQRPSVILSDYRLREGRTGIEAIATLRAAFGEHIPAAVLTGDTGSDTIAALNASGLPVLHKPFKPAKLRAFLTHLLAGQAAGELPT